ncbi:hypothetical protein FISHEDRAFT_71748 [Fistulina hepatica ATCC 64428]|uniref:F-box domain-containing protein n=1 Tax=Fistulina hepatica ATCC 64428 TaxID=1128425 RepID=A0A0D7AIH6_9AGAR|nr:hypothetical protein FISHEDRAFT_71748 [Fistulina hepatica ATCC 64428]
MSKHILSPASLPPAKRTHVGGPSASASHTKLAVTFESALFDELIIHIFAHVSWVDLCRTQSTSRNWSRLASDNELWKTLYLSTFGRSRLRGTRGFVQRADGREVRPLPGRMPSDSDDSEFRNWKWMFRISRNWKTGRCAIEDIGTSDEGRTHMLLAGSLTISASEPLSLCPKVELRTPQASYTLLCRGTTPNVPLRITALALDHSPPHGGHVHVAVFTSDGSFTLCSVDQSYLPASRRTLTYIPLRSASSRVIKAAYHHPLLVTLSDVFTLSIYDVSSNPVQLTQTLTSFTSYPPTSLVLSITPARTYKLVIAFSIPVYPAHWSVGATEVMITGLGSNSADPEGMLLPSMTVLSTRTIRTIDVPQGWIDERKLRNMRDQWNRKVSRVADTETDGKWLVLAPEAQPPSPHSPSSSRSSTPVTPTVLQLYRLSLPAAKSIASSPPKLTFVRELHGPIGPVLALSLADGRCVSLGKNGSIWVWDLETGSGAEVALPNDDMISAPAQDADAGCVAFDERKIITAVAGKIMIRRFDV